MHIPATKDVFCFLQIANVLLHNKRKWDNDRVLRCGTDHRPILVVCYTNHALDQFLEGIHQFHSDGIVRVGGRSQSETMQACSLSELKHKMHKVRVHILVKSARIQNRPGKPCKLNSRARFQLLTQDFVAWSSFSLGRILIRGKFC